MFFLLFYSSSSFLFLNPRRGILFLLLIRFLFLFYLLLCPAAGPGLVLKVDWPVQLCNRKQNLQRLSRLKTKTTHWSKKNKLTRSLRGNGRDAVEGLASLHCDLWYKKGIKFGKSIVPHVPYEKKLVNMVLLEENAKLYRF